MPRVLLVAGSINADLYVEIDRLPRPGETIPGGGAAVRPGGKGANQAAAAARLGLPTRFAGLVGSDPFAADLRAALAATGCDIGLLGTAPGPTGQAFILLQRGGENSIVIVGGANRAWPEPLPPALPAAVAAARVLLLQREIPLAVNTALARMARAAGVPAVLDAGGDDGPLPPALLADLALLSPNETELARLTGLPTASDAEVLAAACALQAQGVGEVLVKLGARGVLLVQRDGAVLRQDAFRVAVVDTTGAGDCCTAAYAVAWAEGRAPQERLRFACAAAALCVQAKGAMPAMPARAAVDAFLRERA
jgi:ribokinase